MKSLTPSVVLKSTLLIAAGILALVGCKPKAPEFSLVKDGKPQATIIIAKEPSKTTLFAVQELNEHLELVAGAKLPVVDDAAEVKGPRVLVGESAATKALGLKSADFKDQEYLVQATPDTLILMGKDDFEAPVAEGAEDDIWVDGKWGKALAFDENTVFTVDQHGFDDREGTLECWVQIAAGKPSSGTILRLTSGRDHVVLLLECNSVLYRSIHDGRETSLRADNLAPGWHHIMATHSVASGKVELFVDGVSRGSGVYHQTGVAQSKLYIGGFFVGFKNTIWTPLRGTIDEIRISRSIRPAVAATAPFEADGETTLLLDCDEGHGAPAGTVRSGEAAMLAALPNAFANNGTLYAVYEFLENDCGVRWYAPGELGTVVDKQPTLTVKTGQDRRSPAMTFREISWSEQRGARRSAYTVYDKALWSLRMRAGGENIMQGMHSFIGYRDRFSKSYGTNPNAFEVDRPEFFAKGLTEAQMMAPDKPGGMPNLCYSSPELVAQVVQDARNYFDGKGLKLGGMARGDYFALGPMDMAPYCKCADCQAALRSPADAIDRGYVGDYWYGFVNRIAKELRKTHPDKILPILAYHDYANPPEGFVLEPNVSVTFCALGPSMWWDPARRERDRRAFDNGWALQGKNHAFQLYGWLYYLGGMMGQTDADYPDACAFQVPAFIKSLYDAGMRGLYIQQAENVGYSFLMSQLELYLTLKLAADPTLDGKALIDEFFVRYYGEAGSMMKQLYAEMEQVKFDISNYPEEVRRGDKYNLLSPEIAYRYLVTPERAERWGKLMDEAVASATGVHKERVQQYKTGVWDRMTAERAKFLAKSAPQSNQPAAKKSDLVSALQENFDDKAGLQNWKLIEAGKMELAGTSIAPFEGKDSVKVVPENPVQDKVRTILQSNQKMAAAKDSTITVSFAIRGDGQGLGGNVILDCFDESGKMLKAIWKPLPVSSDWKQVKVDYRLDEATVGSPNCASVGLRILCHGEGAYYLDDLSVSKK